MTNKPEHTRPFNLEHAKAGAPYCCVSGEKATILKWDCNNPKYPLEGICEEHDYPESWAADGVQSKDDYPKHGSRNLVMLPLCYVEDKPAFVGDKIVLPDGSEHTIRPVDRPADDCTWPKPVYPETTCPVDTLAIAYNAQDGFSRSLRAVANYAIARAIEDGQVVPVKNMTLTQAHFAMKHMTAEQIADFLSDQPSISGTVQALIEMSEKMVPAAILEQVAEAASRATYNAILSVNYNIAYCDLKLDMAAIIASVKEGK